MAKVDLSFLTRKKVFTKNSLEETRLNRVLGLLDVLFIGIGMTLGSGIYILSGGVIRYEAGPATVIAFLIAGVWMLSFHLNQRLKPVKSDQLRVN